MSRQTQSFANSRTLIRRCAPPSPAGGRRQRQRRQLCSLSRLRERAGVRVRGGAMSWQTRSFANSRTLIRRYAPPSPAGGRRQRQWRQLCSLSRLRERVGVRVRGRAMSRQARSFANSRTLIRRCAPPSPAGGRRQRQRPRRQLCSLSRLRERAGVRVRGGAMSWHIDLSLTAAPSSGATRLLLPQAGEGNGSGAARSTLVHTLNARPLHYFPACSALRICASTAASAVMLTTRRGVEAGVSTCAGWSMPIRIGPMATPSVITRTML